MNDLIEKIKKIMTDVATGQAKIQDTNDEYKKLFRELDDIFSNTNQKNPNGFSDLEKRDAVRGETLETDS